MSLVRVPLSGAGKLRVQEYRPFFGHWEQHKRIIFIPFRYSDTAGFTCN